MRTNNSKEAAESLGNTGKTEPGKGAYPDHCVYCGPSIPGVAKQYSVYTGGIPKELAQFVDKHPAARGLLVSVNMFPQVRKRLETPDTSESILYRKIKSEL